MGRISCRVGAVVPEVSMGKGKWKGKCNGIQVPQIF